MEESHDPLDFTPVRPSGTIQVTLEFAGRARPLPFEDEEMDIKKLIGKIGGGAVWPFRRISEEVGEELAEKVSMGVRAGLAEAPILDALFDGREIEAEVKVSVRLRAKG